MSAEISIVERLYDEFNDLVAYLESGGEISLRSNADANFRKSLLLAAASYFEHRITEDIISFVEEISLQNELMIEFTKNKAIKRQYHTFFNWDAVNANQFFGLFGESFKNFMQAEIRNDEIFDAAIKAFLEIGRERNRLVHQDFGTFTLEKTANEIFDLYKTALVFVNGMQGKLRQFKMAT